MRTVINQGAVATGGHYSPAVRAGDLVFVSGQGPVRPEDGTIPDNFADQVRQTLRNLATVLEHAGASLADVVRVGVFLSDVTRFREFDAVYREFFGDGPPARTTVGAALIGIQVEIDCVAALPHPA